MPKLSEITAAGYSPQAPSTADELLKAISGGVTQGLQERPNRMKKQMEEYDDQMKFYKNLRDAGYSPEEAHDRVKKMIEGGSGTSFIQKILTGAAKNVFSPGSEEDQTSLNRKKERAELEKTKAETGLANAKTGYYKDGGPRRSVIDKMTPNQLQSRLKFITDPASNPDYDSEETKAEAAYITQKIQDISGFSPGGTPPASVMMKAPDGSVRSVPADRVAYYEKKGAKRA
jgi:hypothetical protein